MRASDFVNTLGVNTHLGSEQYDDIDQLSGMLSYLGIDNVRQSSPINAFSFDLTEALGKTGAKIDLIINGGGPVNLAGAMDNVYQLSPYLNAVENVNEAAIYPITYGGFTGIDAAVALQKDLYAAVRADPALNDVPVYMFSIGGADPSAFPSLGDLSAYADFANIHAYPPDALRPIFVIHAAIAGGRTDAPSKPVVLTETGFYTLQNGTGWGGVPETLQASYLLDLVLDEAVAGVSRTYLYDLIDDSPDFAQINQEAHFGLFHVDGTPKLSATAVHNLTTILYDDGPLAHSFTPAPFPYTASGIPYDYTGNTTVIDKSDGSHIIALWNEQQTWDTIQLTDIPITGVPVTVDLQTTFSTVLVFDPMAGTDPIQTFHDVSQVSLDLLDHPLLVEVLPHAPTQTSAVTPPPVDPPPVAPATISPWTISPPDAAPSTLDPPAAAQSMVDPLAAAPSTIDPSAAAPSTVDPSAATPSMVNPPAAVPSTIDPPAPTPSTVDPSAATPSGVNPPAAARLAIDPPAAAPSTIDVPAVAPPPSASGSFAGFVDQATCEQGSVPLAPTAGDPSYLQWMFIWNSSDGVALSSSVPNVFLHGGPGEDAIATTSGQNVLDGGSGSNFLTGGSGIDTFFTDARGADVVWNTVQNFHLGDSVTLWGFVSGVSSYTWDPEEEGAQDATGATLRANIAGGVGRAGSGIDASITFAGLSVSQARALLLSSGTQAAGPYLSFYNPGV